jgi:undecaprenyl-diphosphatase
MSVLQAAVLGAIQGLTEFLPISSSAHLLLVPYILGWSYGGVAFDVALHVGTLVALLFYFRRDWVAMATAALRALSSRKVGGAEEMQAVFLVVALVPAVVAGLLLEDMISAARQYPHVTAATLIVLGIILWVADRVAPSTRQLKSMRARDAFLIGVAQALALVPGVSRSGATMTAGRLLAFDRYSAARFSFLMSMPVIAAAAARKVPEALAAQGLSPQLLAGTAAAAITGWLAIGFLLRFLTTRGFAVFAIYRIALGIVVYAITLARG